MNPAINSGLEADDIVTLLSAANAFRRPGIYKALQICEAHQAACNTLASHLMPTAAALYPATFLHVLKKLPVISICIDNYHT